MTLSASHTSCLAFTNAFDRVLISMRFWKADRHPWNREGWWEAVSQSCCLFREQWMDGNWLYPTKESSVIISDASSKKCLAQAHLPRSLKPCIDTLACENWSTRHQGNGDGTQRLWPCPLLGLHEALFRVGSRDKDVTTARTTSCAVEASLVQSPPNENDSSKARQSSATRRGLVAEYNGRLPRTAVAKVV